MEKNLIIFVVLSVLLFVGWSYYNNKYMLPARQQALQGESGRAAPSVAPQAAPAAVPGAGRAKVPAEAQAAKSGPEKEETVEVRTGTLKVVLSSRGAQVKSWKLLPFTEGIDDPSPVELIPPDSQGALGVPAYGALRMRYLSNLDSGTWKLETRTPEKAADGSQRVVFSAVLDSTPLRFRKTFVFQKDGYLADVLVEASNPDSKPWDLKSGLAFAWGPNVGRPAEGRMQGMAMSAVVQTKKKLAREMQKDRNETFEYTAPRWIALRNQYFLSAFLAEGEGWTKAEVRRYSNNSMQTALVTDDLVLSPGEKKEYRLKMLGGPQQYSLLKSFNNNLHRVIQFSFFKIFAWLDPLSVGMLLLMNWLYKVIGNYGVAIILLTILVRLVLVYPSQKSMVSMRKMSKAMEKAKPRIDALRKTYANDQQKMNQEMMAIYKEYGINPLGGCLPMLIQMPILFALYPVFYAAFELRGKGFFWKWEDLTTGDPTHIMALAMGASMFLQQKLTPQTTATADPTQQQTQKMMLYIMPVMLTVMAIWWKWPSGFLLYWGASNVFSIAQQIYVNRIVK